MIIKKNGKTKNQLLICLENLKSEFAKEISGNDVKITNITDGYSIKGEKKFLFLNFWVDAKIIAKEQEFELSWETNAPEGKVKEAMKNVEEILEKC